MSIDALIVGRLADKPQSRISKSGTTTFVTCKLRTSQASGEVIFLNVIAFSETAKNTLLTLTEGDSAAIAGELRATAYLNKDGAARPSLDLTAFVVTSEYHVQRKRRAVTEPAEPARVPAQAQGEW
jgi:single-stranded DNA-binding protein